MKENEYKVAGYSFSNENDYKQAKQDMETIDLIKSKTDLNDLNKVIKLYHKLVERRSFHTTVGYSFLKELQERILKDSLLSKTNIPLIPVHKLEMELSSFTKSMHEEKDRKYHATIQNYKIKLRNSRIISAFLFVIIIAMLLISVFSDKYTFINYKNEILDRYSTWEEDLESREKALDERENKLKKQEATESLN